MKTIQVRHVPDELYAALEAKAALSGQPLNDYLLGELRGLVAGPARGELLGSLRSSRVAGLTAAADVLANERPDR